MINSRALFDTLFQQGLQPEFVEDDSEITICCPQCGDERPRLYINAETAAWVCFHCHEQGGLHALLMTICQLSGHESFDASRSIRLNTGEDDYFELQEDKKDDPKKGDAKVLALPSRFEPITRDSPSRFLDYLTARGVSPDLAAARGIGYATGGYYGNRIIVPVQNDGVLYTYIARTIRRKCPSCAEVLDDCVCTPRRFPKVLTPSTGDGARPRLTLYNLDPVRRSTSPRVVVVEGVFDALRRPGDAVALLGSSASATQIALLAGITRGREVILALDADEAGYKGTLKVAEALLSELVRVKIALLPDGKDPGDLSGDELEACINAARPFVV